MHNWATFPTSIKPADTDSLPYLKRLDYPRIPPSTFATCHDESCRRAAGIFASNDSSSQATFPWKIFINKKTLPIHSLNVSIIYRSIQVSTQRQRCGKHREEHLVHASDVKTQSYHFFSQF